MAELRVIVGSDEQIPAVVTVGGVDQTDGFKVKLVPFETGGEAVDLADGPSWKIAPASAVDYPTGYYCVYTAIELAGKRITDHAADHVRITSR